MNMASKIASLLALAVIMLVAGIAATPAALAKPSQPTVSATASAGELQVSWNSVPSAQHYTVGYANLDDLNQMAAAGRNALDAFYYVTVGAGNTGHTLNGLKPETAYYVLIGAQTERFGATDLSWGPWSNAVTTAGQHGAGFCPITGLQIPEEGYLNVGNTRTWSDATLKLDSATSPASVPVRGQPDHVPYDGRKLLRLCVTQTNQTGGDLYFQAGSHNNLSTDRGIGFVRVTGWSDTPIENGTTEMACDTWSVPEPATTAVYAISDGDRADVLFRIDLSSIPTTIPTSSSTNTTDTASVVNQRHIQQKQYMLGLINSQRADAGVGSVTLGDNVAAQLQAEAGLENCFSSHWGLDGLKPYMRYSLAGGYQSNGENARGWNYCITAADGYAPISGIIQEIREAIDGWMQSPGHRRNLLDRWHKQVNIGLAWNRYNTVMYQHFEGDYVEFDQPPSIVNNVLYISGTAKNGAGFDENRDLAVQIYYEPPTHALTRGQVARTYCYDYGLPVAALRWPLGAGYTWTTHEYTTTHTSCPDPYDVPANTPAPNSVDESLDAWQEAYDASQSATPQSITVPWITASQWTASGSALAVRANLSEILNRHGNGVYSVAIWGTIGDEDVEISRRTIFRGVSPPDNYSLDD